MQTSKDIRDLPNWEEAAQITQVKIRIETTVLIQEPATEVMVVTEVVVADTEKIIKDID